MNSLLLTLSKLNPGNICNIIWLRLILLTIAASSYPQQQNLNDSSFAYYPLQDGMKWVYHLKMETTVTEEWDLTREVIKDTVLNDGFIYKKTSVKDFHTLRYEYFRIDSVTGFVNFVNSEWPFMMPVPLFLEQGDTLHQYGGLTFVSWDLFNKWGLSEPIKNFKFTNSLNEASFKLIKNVGLDSIVINFDFGVFTYNLKGFISNGIVYGDTSIILSSDEDAPPLNDFRVYQNYPNPFNSSTTIVFSLEKTNNVKIIVYDILGEEVTVLADETRSPGLYSVKFNASGLPGGVYFYKCQMDGIVNVKKMILLR